MRNIVRKILSIFLLVSLVGVSSVFGYEADNNVLNNLQFEERVLEYKNSLKNNLSLSEYKEFENKFENLTKKQKEDLLNLVNNPDKYLNLLSKKYYNSGGIVVKTDTKIENKSNSLLRSSDNLFTTRAITNKNLTIWGIDLIKITSWVEYSHDRKKIKEVIGTYSGVDRNLTVVNDYSFSGHTVMKRDTTVTYTVQVTYKFIHKDFGITISTAEMGVKGGFYGKIYDWWKPR